MANSLTRQFWFKIPTMPASGGRFRPHAQLPSRVSRTNRVDNIWSRKPHAKIVSKTRKYHIFLEKIYPFPRFSGERSPPANEGTRKDVTQVQVSSEAPFFRSPPTPYEGGNLPAECRSARRGIRPTTPELDALERALVPAGTKARSTSLRDQRRPSIAPFLARDERRRGRSEVL